MTPLPLIRTRIAALTIGCVGTLIALSAQISTSAPRVSAKIQAPETSPPEISGLSRPDHSLWGFDQVEAPRAWEISRGSKNIVVAVIDTGVDLNHPSLRENLWVNPGESGLDAQGNPRETNGIDDDGNGYIDDVHGWNFVRDNHDLQDNHGHGTHIAGIIGAHPSSLGFTGVSPNVSLMILKYYDSRSARLNPLASTVKAILYASQMGAHIINYSGGGSQPSEIEEKAIRIANQKGILFVAAAGNENSDSDLKGYFPAGYEIPNVLSVTAFDPRRNILPSSNFGLRSVDLAAPGENIFSTLPGGRFGVMTGTSQATAFATGVAALLLSHRPDLRTPERLIEYLIQTGETDPKLRGKTKYRVRLNSHRALAIENSGTTVYGGRTAFTSSIASDLYSLHPE